ncbi:TPA: tRNA (adenosine(37)-N6)-dimethylallyltransferase MiaA [Candidatus Gastranaerophilales bacterium HUM_2]|nr:MAG TPA: tRNA (adenosine(37)-N6)-dimethylallyltransferase MiaA [Candidatus Gastranaerophilales bacterium HUM_2]
MRVEMNNRVIAVVGATASGKTSYAIELAKKINGEIISADSRLVYKGMNIGTAKPTIDEMQEIPHYMIDVVEPEYNYSVGLYVKEAKKHITDIISRGKVPIVVGGTGLYFRVLLENYDLPDVKPDYELRKELSSYSYEELLEMLTKLDEKAANSVEKNDKKKLIRYIEIIKLAGKPLDLVRGVKEKEFNVEWVGLNFPREILYDRINKRVDLMIEQGLIDETKKLLQKHGRISNITDTIGYREVLSYLDGELSLDEAKDKLKQNTRNYAKRQLTWFRKNEQINWNCYPDRKKK